MALVGARGDGHEWTAAGDQREVDFDDQREHVLSREVILWRRAAAASLEQSGDLGPRRCVNRGAPRRVTGRGLERGGGTLRRRLESSADGSTRMERIGQNMTFKRPMDMELGPDGCLYLIEYGTAWGNNKDTQIVRLEYTGGQN